MNEMFRSIKSLKASNRAS
jgi:hypothetical protein